MCQLHIAVHMVRQMLPHIVFLCSAASADLVEKSQAAQKLLKVVIAGLSEDAHSEEVRKVVYVSCFTSTGSYVSSVRARKPDTVFEPSTTKWVCAQAIAPCSERVELHATDEG